MGNSPVTRPSHRPNPLVRRQGVTSRNRGYCRIETPIPGPRTGMPVSRSQPLQAAGTSIRCALFRSLPRTQTTPPPSPHSHSSLVCLASLPLSHPLTRKHLAKRGGGGMLWQSLAPARPGPPHRRPDLVLGKVDPVREGVPRRVVDVGQPLLRPLHGHGHDSEGFQSRAAFDSVGDAVASLNVPVSGEEHDTAPRSLQVSFEFQFGWGFWGAGEWGKFCVRRGGDFST